MKRRLLIIAVFLLLGAVVNVAVAWGCALWSKPSHSTDKSGPRDLGFGYTVVFYEDAVGASDRLRIFFPVEIAAGWPLRCLERYPIFFPDLSPFYNEERTVIQAGIPLPPLLEWIHPLPNRTLPIRPVPAGFTLNTLFYAALLWLLIPGPFVLRRFLRLRRGLCPKCAYPMGESAVCTECGRALPCTSTADPAGTSPPS